jgi:hypothetical protein
MLDEMDLLIKPSQIVIANKLNGQIENSVVLELKEVKITLIPLRQFKTMRKKSIFFNILIRCNRMKVL